MDDRIHDPELKARMVERMAQVKGRPRSEEAKAAILAMIRKPMTAERRAKLDEMKRGRARPPQDG